MDKFRKIVYKIFNSGVRAECLLDELRRARLVNIACMSSWVLTPIIFVFQWRIGNTHELYPILAYYSSTLLTFYLNIKNNQLAGIILILGSSVTSWWVTLISDTQVAAPYFNILFGLLTFYLIKNQLIKNVLLVMTFLSFAFLNLIQLLEKPFSLPDYAPIIILLIGLYIGITAFDKLYQRNEKIIKEQGDDLLKLQREKHDQQMAMRQKDMDTVLANNQMQLKIRENILLELEGIKNDDDTVKKLRSMRLKLKSQIETQRKLQFSQENVQESNADLYNRLIQEFPNLNKRELELSSYIRLGLTAREMAELLSSTENSIYVTKNRLRSKLKLPADIDLNSFLINF